MLGEWVGQIVVGWDPDYLEVLLFCLVADPVEAHVKSTGSELLDVVVGYAGGRSVVGVDRCGRLGVSEIEEDLAVHFAVFHVGEEGGEFCFGCG